MLTPTPIETVQRVIWPSERAGYRYAERSSCFEPHGCRSNWRLTVWVRHGQPSQLRLQEVSATAPERTLIMTEEKPAPGTDPGDVGPASSTPLGHRHPSSTIIPPVAANTRYFEAGPVAIGVEYRLITSDIVNANLEAASHELRTEHVPVTVPEDGGVSLHVVDAATRAEYLRFDIFDGSPHYHYIHPGKYQVNIPYDRAACGEMLDWVQRCLLYRLRDMLEFCGAWTAAAGLDPAKIEAVVPDVVQAARGASSPV